MNPRRFPEDDDKVWKLHRANTILSFIFTGAIILITLLFAIMLSGCTQKI